MGTQPLPDGVNLEGFSGQNYSFDCNDLNGNIEMSGSPGNYQGINLPAGLNGVYLSGSGNNHMLEVFDSSWQQLFTANTSNGINSTYTINTCYGCGTCGTVVVSGL